MYFYGSRLVETSGENSLRTEHFDSWSSIKQLSSTFARKMNEFLAFLFSYIHTLCVCVWIMSLGDAFASEIGVCLRI